MVISSSRWFMKGMTYGLGAKTLILTQWCAKMQMIITIKVARMTRRTQVRDSIVVIEQRQRKRRCFRDDNFQETD